MSTFVLVHGAWHGAWCWYRVVPGLEAAGHTVLTPDLPSHGIDHADPGNVLMDDYCARVIDVIDAAGGPVILLGHSMGGMVVSQVAERRPEAISKLVYLTAFLPQNGHSLLDESHGITDSLVAPNIEPDTEAGIAHFPLEKTTEAFFHDCEPQDIALAHRLLSPQPLKPLGTPVTLSAENFGSVERVYIEATEDRAITLWAQREMQARHPCVQTLTLNCGHEPFFACPDALVEALNSIA